MLARVRSHVVGNKFVSWIRTHKRIVIPVFIILLILLIIFRPKGPEPLETVVVKEGTITEVLSATGTVAAETTVDLKFLAGGKVTYLGAEEGEEVSKGQTLATLDLRSTQKTLENSMRDYAKQRNTFESTKDANEDLTPQTARDDAMRRVLENNQYDLEKAVASVEVQELAKQNSVLTTPIDGLLIRSDIKVVGVNAGPTDTFTVVDPGTLLFQVEVDEADIGKVSLGQRVSIVLDAYPDSHISGTVREIDFASHDTDTGGNAFYVEVELPLGAYTYRLGMGGDAEIVLAEKHMTLVIPIATLEDEAYVYVKTEKGFEKRQVKTGIQSDTDVEIISGLTKGEVIALQPEEAAKQVKQKANGK